MSKHTPGPWHVYEDEEEPSLVVSHETAPSYYNPIWGRIFASRPITDTDRANARLIAAAPEMLEALKDARKMLAVKREGSNFLPIATLASIDAAIAKAEGRE